MSDDTKVLTAPHVLEYPYTRSVGPVLGRFFGALRDGHIVGIRARDGRVLVPPQEYDPLTGDELTEFVDVGTSGVLTSWTWIAEPRPKHPLQEPFAFALVKLDGADTAMLHCVIAPDEASVKTGMRVRAVFRDDREGDIKDIAYFEAER